jgi:hypothetical protein
VWFVDAHERCVKRMHDGLLAYYATDRAKLLEFIDAEKLTHILVQKERVGPLFAVRSGVAEPIQSELKKHLAGKKAEQFVLNRPPTSAILFTHGQYQLLDVAALKAAWASSPEPVPSQ